MDITKPVIILSSACLFLITILGIAQADSVNLDIPNFDDYKVTDIYNGQSGEIDLSSSPMAKQFKTKLREGIKNGVNFSGRYPIVFWGCGTNCRQHAIINTKTGKVCAGFNSCGGELYRKNSRLLIVNPKVDGENIYPQNCVTEYYTWDGKALKKIK